MKNKNLQDIEENVLNWRAMAGYVYLMICIFDFILMPVAMYWERADSTDVIIELVESDDHKEYALKLMDRIKNTTWAPLTLIGGGLFHLSFGAILTGAAVTRGFERREIVKQNGQYGNGQPKDH